MERYNNLNICTPSLHESCAETNLDRIRPERILMHVNVLQMQTPHIKLPSATSRCEGGQRHGIYHFDQQWTLEIDAAKDHISADLSVD